MPHRARQFETPSKLDSNMERDINHMYYPWYKEANRISSDE
jgi:hypothetical protein